MIDSTDFFILKTVATYHTLQRPDIQALCLPHTDTQGRTARRHLGKLCQLGYLHKTRGEVLFPDINGAPAPVYFISAKGADLLYCETKDESFLSLNTYTPNPQHLNHFVAVARFHILLDQAALLHPEVTVESFTGEWEVLDHHAPSDKPEKRYRLYTLIQENPRLVCAPDASFVLGYKGYKRGYFLELDRSTTGLKTVARSKTPGFAALAQPEHKQLMERLFPCAADVPFRVLMVTPDQGRRDALAKLIADKQGAPLWRFLSLTKKVQKEIHRDASGADRGHAPASIAEFARVTPQGLFFDWEVLGCDGIARGMIRREEPAR
jgi:hypothetical protein